jgi:Mu transposase, C-terminal domain
VVEVHTLADEVRIFEDGTLIATHPVLEGRHQSSNQNRGFVVRLLFTFFDTL